MIHKYWKVENKSGENNSFLDTGVLKLIYPTKFCEYEAVDNAGAVVDGDSHHKDELEQLYDGGGCNVREGPHHVSYRHTRQKHNGEYLNN